MNSFYRAEDTLLDMVEGSPLQRIIGWLLTPFLMILSVKSGLISEPAVQLVNDLMGISDEADILMNIFGIILILATVCAVDIVGAVVVQQIAMTITSLFIRSEGLDISFFLQVSIASILKIGGYVILAAFVEYIILMLGAGASAIFMHLTNGHLFFLHVTDETALVVGMAISTGLWIWIKASLLIMDVKSLMRG